MSMAARGEAPAGLPPLLPPAFGAVPGGVCLRRPQPCPAAPCPTPLCPAAAAGPAGIGAALKRAEDIALALLLLALLLPLLLACALAIRLDSPGPVLFRQERAGRGGRVFRILKFRTFHHRAADPRALRQTQRHDRRVTRVGAFLRRHSLDELPQLLNVLRGEMSMVGPRPHALGMSLHGAPLEAALPCYAARHRVRPGMTGLAQVRGWRGNVDTLEKLAGRVASDLHYIRTWSLALDLGILLRSIPCVLRDEQAF